MGRKKILIIMAGGRGTRMESSVPKQFMRLGGKALLHLSIERFLEAEPDIKVITVLPQEHIETWKRYCLESGFICPQTLVPGGITRFHSVRNGLARVPDGAIVAVHDGVRPFVSVDLIRKMFLMAEDVPAIVPVVPCVDTLKVLRKSRDGEGRTVFEPVEGAAADRDVLFGAQTPQVFHDEVLKDAYMQAFDTSFTDDASVVERKKIPITYVEGERYNMKITTKEDLILAEALSRMMLLL